MALSFTDLVQGGMAHEPPPAGFPGGLVSTTEHAATALSRRLQVEPARRQELTRKIEELEYLSYSRKGSPRALAQRIWDARRALMGTPRWEYGSPGARSYGRGWESSAELETRLKAIERREGVGLTSPRLASSYAAFQGAGLAGLGRLPARWGELQSPVEKLASCIRGMACDPEGFCCPPKCDPHHGQPRPPQHSCPHCCCMPCCCATGAPEWRPRPRPFPHPKFGAGAPGEPGGDPGGDPGGAPGGGAGGGIMRAPPGVMVGPPVVVAGGMPGGLPDGFKIPAGAWELKDGKFARVGVDPRVTVVGGKAYRKGLTPEELKARGIEMRDGKYYRIPPKAAPRPEPKPSTPKDPGGWLTDPVTGPWGGGGTPMPGTPPVPFPLAPEKGEVTRAGPMLPGPRDPGFPGPAPEPHMPPPFPPVGKGAVPPRKPSGGILVPPGKTVTTPGPILGPTVPPPPPPAKPLTWAPRVAPRVTTTGPVVPLAPPFSPPPSPPPPSRPDSSRPQRPDHYFAMAHGVGPTGGQTGAAPPPGTDKDWDYWKSLGAKWANYVSWKSGKGVLFPSRAGVPGSAPLMGLSGLGQTHAGMAQLAASLRRTRASLAKRKIRW